MESNLFDLVSLAPASKIKAIRNGIPAVQAEYFRTVLGLTQKALFTILGTNERTGIRLLKEQRTLDPAASERLLRLVETEKHAENAFGRPDLAVRWMTTFNRTLGAAPVELLDTETGHEQVRKSLVAIEHGLPV